jgi:hypothetical protein
MEILIGHVFMGSVFLALSMLVWAEFGRRPSRKASILLMASYAAVGALEWQLLHSNRRAFEPICIAMTLASLAVGGGVILMPCLKIVLRELRRSD